MKIGSHETDDSVFIVAEVGNNHEGDFGLARELVCAAAEAGVDAVKFQTIVPHKLVSPLQIERIAQLSRFQLTYEQFAELAALSNQKGIQFMSTPFDLDSARYLNEFVPAFKVASSDNTFYPLIDALAESGKPIIMSTGLACRKQVSKAAERVYSIWNDMGVSPGLALLHCVSSYPTPVEEVNLLTIPELAVIADEIGYSDHSLGVDASVYSTVLGARIVEKHFTLDKSYSNFRDHQLSADVNEMRQLVQKVRVIEKMLGVRGIQVAQCENDNLEAFRRSAVAASDLDKGTILTPEHISWVRPGVGIAPEESYMLYGKRLMYSVAAGEILTSNLLD